ELHPLAIAQILEVDFRRQARAMEEHLVAAVVGRDESEALVLHYFLDRSRHNEFPSTPRRLRPLRVSSQRAVSKVEVTSRAPYVKEYRIKRGIRAQGSYAQGNRKNLRGHRTDGHLAGGGGDSAAHRDSRARQYRQGWQAADYRRARRQLRRMGARPRSENPRSDG